MPDYDLHVLCFECGNFHDVVMRVSLEKSFEVCVVSDIYDGEIPHSADAIALTQTFNADRNIPHVLFPVGDCAGPFKRDIRCGRLSSLSVSPLLI